nr:HU family DNA-binding protein [uncultured Bacteroides sp.]
MNEKLNIQDLIDLLAEKHGMSRKNADSFVKEFFLLIEESLEKDKYVKIRGLGTFKLIDVESRESVNVNTGERFEIQGHTKVSFTPEPSLKDIINKPFAHFETVVLNDNTVLEDTPLDTDNEEDEDGEQKNPEPNIDTKVQATEVNEESPIVAEAKDVQFIEPKPAEEEDIEFTEKTVVISEEVETAFEETPKKQEEIPEEFEEERHQIAETALEISSNATEEGTEAEIEMTPIPEPVLEQSIPEQPEPMVKESEDSSTMKYFIGIVVFVVLLCGGAVVFMYYPDLLDSSSSKPVEEAVIQEKVEKPTDNMASADSLSSKDIVQPVQKDTVAEVLNTTSQQKNISEENAAASTPRKEQKKSEATPFKPDSVGYTIVGTETTYTIKEGETLTRVALRFYGTKALWPYIVKYNPGVIKNPDNVPFGTKIKIPKLVKKQ